MSLYIGLMSGTSIDGIDAVLLQIGPAGIALRAATHQVWPEQLHRRLEQAVAHPAATGLDELGELDRGVGEEFARAALGLLAAAGEPASAVRAIGSHGQTIRHRPGGALPFTLQIGDPNLIAERTGIDVVADFRRRDMAAGGEGAPLVPAFHAAAFGASQEPRAVINIGGIANVTLLGTGGEVLGFDTGPGNCLLDAWIKHSQALGFDRHGEWAATGNVDALLLRRWLNEPYFSRPAPKSTGRELFNFAWLETALAGSNRRAADVQATLAELTAHSIAAALMQAPESLRARRALVCGGGAYNQDLMRRLAAALPGVPVDTTARCGIAPEHVEGAAFAWLAHRYLTGQAGNIPAVTGAAHPVPLGALYPGGAGRTSLTPMRAEAGFIEPGRAKP
jgi:anhydro-N-acetylmuramic acid kinase